MSLWNWFYDSSARAESELEQRFFNHFWMGMQLIDDACEMAVSNMDKAREIAVEIENPAYVLMCDHWIMQAQLRGVGDVQEIIERGIRTTVDAQSPSCAHVPQRVCAHEDLLYAFVIADPHGYSEKIQRALDFMQREISPGVECSLCLERCRTLFYLATDRLDEAASAADRYASTDFAYHQSRACENLCTVAYRKRDWQSLLGYVHLAESLAREQGKREIREFLAWKALALYKLGQPGEAERAAVDSIRKPVPSGLSTNYYDALSSYYEARGNFDLAWQTRECELNEIAGKSRHWEECLCRAKRCALLAASGREVDLQVERGGLDRAAEELVQPERFDWDEIIGRYSG